MIYFDNAATTFPKPPDVIKSMSECMKKYCGNPGRSAHALSLRSAEAVYDTRCEIAELFGSSKPENVIFTQNATHALNIAISGLARRGDHILISNLEHNSVLRPVVELCRRGVVGYGVFDALGDDDMTLSNIEKALRPDTNIIITTHVSNICPKILPIKKISKFCRERGIIHIVDASQSAGIFNIDMTDGYTVVCAPGHKGLYGPQGSGFCIFSDDFDFKSLMPLIYGGNGVDSAKPGMGNTSPESFEAGTLAVPNIVGLCAGIKFIKKRGIENIRDHESAVCRKIKNHLRNIEGVKIYLPNENEASVILLNISKINAAEFAERLSERGVCTRSGLHCSPLAHKALGTGGDAIRLSFSAFNTFNEAHEFCRIFEEEIDRVSICRD
ncbi:MAG: aminotransferase class V-fold PLP-dependent enzyme [Eubacteriales bacterium]